MLSTKKRIIKKALKVMENDLDNTLNKRKTVKSQKNSLFSNFDDDFAKKLNNNKNYIKNIKKSIDSTKK